MKEKNPLLYEEYNREERNLCSHLFRLLLEPKRDYRALELFLGRRFDPDKVKIFSEVALIRDAYYARKPEVDAFMASLVELVARQSGIEDFTPFAELPSDLKDPTQTHPKLIALKFRVFHQDQMRPDDSKLYGSLQGIFSTKPSLAICLEDEMRVYEANYSLGFDSSSVCRTAQIAEIWANLLFQDLGYVSPPMVQVLKLGMEDTEPCVSWEKVAFIADEVLGSCDPTSRAFKEAVVSVRNFRQFHTS